MKKKVIYYLAGICCWGILCTCCTKEEFVFSGNNGSGEVEGEDGGEMTPPVISADAASFLGFTIGFDEGDKLAYGNMEELVEAGNPDFPENHEFVHTVTIDYSASGATWSALPQGVLITSSGAHVTVYSSVEGVEYIVKGQSESGSFKLTGTTDFKLTLNGAVLANPTGAAINIQAPVRAFIVASEGVDNKLVDGTEYTSSKEEGKACVFSKGHLIFCGPGAIAIDGNSKHAIAADGAVTFRGGCRVSAISKVKDGVHATGNIYMGGGQVEITAEGDGIQSEEGMVSLYGGFLKVVTSGVKSHGLKSATDVVIGGGAYHSMVSGAASKCISCDGSVSQSSGKLTLFSTGDSYYDREINDMSSCAGIKCGGNMKMSGGRLEIYSTGAAGKGINCDGLLEISGRSVVKVITEGTRAVQGELTSSPKGISADGGVTVHCDTLWVKATGGEGSEGIDSKVSIVLNAGEMALYCFDDCMSATNKIVVNGGNIYCYSSDNDGMDSNGAVEVHGGQVIAIGAPGAEEGIDYEMGNFTLTGGTVVGIGGEDSWPDTMSSTQNSVSYSGRATEGQMIYVQDANGENTLMYQIPRDFDSMHILLSSAALLAEGTYSLWTGSKDNVHGGTGYFGLYTGSVCTDGERITDFTINAVLTQLGTE